MLVKQQDRLEEREQDIEEQLYKLESDKRLVEVTAIFALSDARTKKVLEAAIMSSNSLMEEIP